MICIAIAGQIRTGIVLVLLMAFAFSGIIGCAGLRRRGQQVLLPNSLPYEESWDAVVEILQQWNVYGLSLNEKNRIIEFKNLPSRIGRYVLGSESVWNSKSSWYPQTAEGRDVRISGGHAEVREEQGTVRLSVALDCERQVLMGGPSHLDSETAPKRFVTSEKAEWFECPCPYAEKRIAKALFEEISATFDPPSLLVGMGEFGAWDGHFDAPFDLAVDGDGFIYVSEPQLHHIKKFSASGDLVATLGDSGSSKSRLSQPKGVSLCEDGNVFVVDSGEGRIQAFTSEGLPSGIEVMPLSDKDMLAPTYLAVSESSVFVMSDSAQSISVYDRKGRGKRSLDAGKEVEELMGSSPIGMALGPDGRLYVLYGKDRCIVQFDQEGHLVERWDKASHERDSLPRSARSLAVDSNGNVYVATMDRVLKFDKKGVLVDFCCEPGVGYGRFKEISAMAIGPEEQVYILDRINKCVQRLK